MFYIAAMADASAASVTVNGLLVAGQIVFGKSPRYIYHIYDYILYFYISFLHTYSFTIKISGLTLTTS